MCLHCRMALSRTLLCVELLLSNTEGPAEPDDEVEGGSVGVPHSAQNRVPGTSGLPHIMQKVFMFISNRTLRSKNRIVWLRIVLHATLEGIVHLVQSPYQRSY